MKINNILENELLKTIEYYYPQDIVETSDLVYINSEETKRRNKAYFNIISYDTSMLYVLNLLVKFRFSSHLKSL